MSKETEFTTKDGWKVKIIKEYEEDRKREQDVDTKYDEAKALKEKWVLRVKEQWFS